MPIVRTLLITMLILTPALVEAKKLKPKYYASCYAKYDDMRSLVPTPPVDIQKTAKTIGAAASLAGRFGGFGGGFGQAASTASTVVKYTDTIADVAAFTQSMSESFPNASDRYIAYGDRMGTEAAEMQQVADDVMASQDCYAAAYAELKHAQENGTMKSREIKKRHAEIATGTGNMTKVLEDASVFMDTNIDAYNKVMNQETTGAGLNLDNLLSLASQAKGVAAQVDGLTPGYGDGWAGTGWTEAEVRMESHRQAMAAHYGAAGVPNPYQEPTLSTEGLFGGYHSLTSLASLGRINPGVAASVALNQGIAGANLANAGQAERVEPTPADNGKDDRIEALIKAGGDVQPYLAAYNRIKALAGIQRGFDAYVSRKP